MCPSKTAFPCRKVHFSAQESVFFCSEALGFCRNTHFSAVCSGGSRIVSGSLFLDDTKLRDTALNGILRGVKHIVSRGFPVDSILF